MIKVVNFPFCNFYSLDRYLRFRSHRYEVLQVLDFVAATDIILLPGVGTFKQGIDYLNSSGLIDKIHAHASTGGRVVGICLGMQMLLDTSSESPEVNGLGLIPGSCERIPASPLFSVPHIGWNTLVLPDSLHACVESLGSPDSISNSDFYFVHTYVAKPSSADSIIASFQHPSGLLAAAVAHQSSIGFQFHPEKSGPAGYSLLDHVLS